MSILVRHAWRTHAQVRENNPIACPTMVPDEKKNDMIAAMGKRIDEDASLHMTKLCSVVGY